MGIAQGIEGKAVGQAAGRTGTWEAPGIPVSVTGCFLRVSVSRINQPQLGFVQEESIRCLGETEVLQREYGSPPKEI